MLALMRLHPTPLAIYIFYFANTIVTNSQNMLKLKKVRPIPYNAQNYIASLLYIDTKVPLKQCGIDYSTPTLLVLELPHILFFILLKEPPHILRVGCRGEKRIPTLAHVIGAVQERGDLAPQGIKTKEEKF